MTTEEAARREAPRRKSILDEALTAIQQWHEREALRWRSGSLAERHRDFALVIAQARIALRS